MLFPDAPAQIEAAHIRQHDIQNGKIELLGFCARQRLPRRIELMHRVVFVFQIQFDEVGDFRLVVHNEDLLGHPISLPRFSLLL